METPGTSVCPQCPLSPMSLPKNPLLNLGYFAIISSCKKKPSLAHFFSFFGQKANNHLSRPIRVFLQIQSKKFKLGFPWMLLI